ncbi:hypothetical protein IFM89_032459 [Coptis chinensis]|uniref:Uncharacterized protein n=1 Tax=Coptis chinensis TaxID=261450 RepID=A0A835I6H6_9MAGN|nr:hypothetical protein IFM89_032459 [Coptis chinensis]
MGKGGGCVPSKKRAPVVASPEERESEQQQQQQTSNNNDIVTTHVEENNNSNLLALPSTTTTAASKLKIFIVFYSMVPETLSIQVLEQMKVPQKDGGLKLYRMPRNWSRLMDFCLAFQLGFDTQLSRYTLCKSSGLAL